MRHPIKKTLLFIEPTSSSSLLVLKAQEKRYDSLVITANFNKNALSEKVINASFALFQVNIKDEVAVLDLVEKISQKFRIDGVIPGAIQYVPLTSKVASQLQKPGLAKEVAFKVQRKDLIRHCLKAHRLPHPRYQIISNSTALKTALQHLGSPCVLKSLYNVDFSLTKKVYTFEEALYAFETILAEEKNEGKVLIEEYIEGETYSVEGFFKNKLLSLVSIVEKLNPIGYIVASDWENLFPCVQPYCKQVLSALELNYGFFRMDIKLTKQGPFLTDISIGLPKDPIPKLIGYATGIDYYHNVLKFFSDQLLSLQKTKCLNAGFTSLYTPNAVETLFENPCVAEINIYSKEEGFIPTVNQKLGHAFLIHKEYEVLKQQLAEIHSKG